MTAGYVLGDMSSTGKMLKPYGQLPEDDAFATFKEQAAILAEGGVDGFIIETMFDLREAVCARAAAVEALRPAGHRLDGLQHRRQRGPHRHGQHRHAVRRSA